MKDQCFGLTKSVIIPNVSVALKRFLNFVMAVLIKYKKIIDDYIIYFLTLTVFLTVFEEYSAL